MSKRISMVAAAATAALLAGVGSASAGTSENDLFRQGGIARDGQLSARPAVRSADRPYALTGDASSRVTTQRRVVVEKDIQTGRGQTTRVPFWVWVND